MERKDRRRVLDRDQFTMRLTAGPCQRSPLDLGCTWDMDASPKRSARLKGLGMLAACQCLRSARLASLAW